MYKYNMSIYIYIYTHITIHMRDFLSYSPSVLVGTMSTVSPVRAPRVLGSLRFRAVSQEVRCGDVVLRGSWAP